MTPKKTMLLIVDDEELVCRVLSRDFKHKFDRVLFATRPEDAEEILATGEVTSVVCDYNLGDGAPRGTELLEKWRKAYPKIERAVIYTGTDPSRIGLTKWIDSTVSKGLPLAHLYTAVAGLSAYRDVKA
jgi:CheY-like chemotaxis protein